MNLRPTPDPDTPIHLRPTQDKLPARDGRAGLEAFCTDIGGTLIDDPRTSSATLQGGPKVCRALAPGLTRELAVKMMESFDTDCVNVPRDGANVEDPAAVIYRPGDLAHCRLQWEAAHGYVTDVKLCNAPAAGAMEHHAACDAMRNGP